MEEVRIGGCNGGGGHHLGHGNLVHGDDGDLFGRLVS